MAEILGIVASVTQLIELSGSLLAGGYGFLSKVIRAPSEMRSLLTEAAAIDSLLGQLQVIAETTPKTAPNDALQALNRLGVFEECMASLKSVQKALKSCEQSQEKDARNLGKRFLWPFKEKETKEDLEKLHRLRGLLANAVEASSASALRRIEAGQGFLQQDLASLSLDFHSHISREEAQKVVAYFCSTTSDGAYSSLESALSRRAPGTGRWFLESEGFKRWGQSKDGTIWITGLPGSGKTILSSSVIEQLRLKRNPTTAVLFYFCDHRDHSKVTHSGFLMTITKQLLDQSPECLAHAKEVYEENSNYPFHRTKYVPLIEELMSRFEEILILVDALDEATEKDQIAESLTTLHGFGKSKGIVTKVILTSRFDLQVERRYPVITSTRITLAENMREDIDNYIKKELEIRMSQGSLKLRNKDLLSSVLQQVGMRAGTLLQAQLQLNYISTAKNDRDIKGMLQSMPDGLDYTYETLLCQAACRSPTQAAEIKTLLTCIVGAASPLTATQLSEIVAMQGGQRYLEFDAVATDPYDTLELIAPFILIDRSEDAEGLVKFAHYSLQEYLLSEKIKEGPAQFFQIDYREANAWLASKCLQYLTFEVFDVSLRTKLTLDMLDMYKFREYAALNWYTHLNDAQGIPGLIQRCAPYIGWFLDGGQGPRCYQRWQYTTHKVFPCNDISKLSPICFAIWAGLDEVVDYLLPFIPSIDSPAADAYTCLAVAAKYNQEAIAQKLINRGADVNKADSERKLTPLHLAAEFGSRETVDLLLKAGADPHARSSSGSTPFYRACRSGDVEILKRLKECGADVNALTHDRWTPLREAAGSGNTEVMDLLRSWGAVRNVY